MDKYEYRIKAEQIRKLAEEGDYESAVKIVSTIDWNRVKSIPMLTLVGKIYAKCNQLEESREIYLIAYDRYPNGRKIIFALAELSIRLGEYIDAVEYYKEFVRVAPRDNGRYILQYKLYEAQEVGIQERIAVLEEFVRHEPIEKWAFELAYLYHRAGMKDKCVEKCDEIVLWFGEGKYVEKAMELKMLYQPLTQEQQEKYDNRNEVEIERSIEAVEEVARRQKQRAEAEDNIHVKTMNIGIYDTVNLQEELKKSMREILNATEQENIDTAMDSVKKLVRDNQLEKIFDENGQTTSIDLKRQKEQRQKEQLIEEEQPQEEIEPEELTERMLETVREMVHKMPDGSVKEGKIEESAEKEPKEGIVTEEPVAKELEEEAVTEESAEEKLEEEAVTEEPAEEKLEEKTVTEEPVEEKAEEEIVTEEPVEEKLEEEAVTEEPVEEKLEEEAVTEEPAEEKLEEEAVTEKPAEETVLKENKSVDRLPVVPDECFVTGDLSDLKLTLDQVAPVKETQEELEKTKEFVVTRRDLALADAPTKRIPIEEINAYLNKAIKVVQKNEEETVTTDQDNQIQALEEEKEQKKQQELQEAKQRALEETENILEKLQGIIPTMPEEMKQLLKEGGIKEKEDVPAKEEDSDISEYTPEPAADDLLELTDEESFDDLEEYEEDEELPDDEDAAAQLQAKLEASLPEGIESLTHEEEKEIPIASKNGHLSGELKEIFTYFAEMEEVNRQLVHALESIELSPCAGNVAIMGGEETGKTTLAVDIIKAVQKSYKFKGKKIVKITGESLNNKDIEQVMENAAGGVLMVEHAGDISLETMKALLIASSKEKKDMIVIIEDSKEKIDALFAECTDFASMFAAQIELPEYTNDDLVAFAKSYAREQGYAIDDIAVLALYSVLDELQFDDHVPTLTEVKDVIDYAIKKAGKKSLRNMIDSIFSKRYDDEHYIYIRERDFE